MLHRFLESLDDPRRHEWQLVHHEVLDAKKADTSAIPEELDPRTISLVQAAGIQELYSHQAEAVRLSAQGHNVCLATPTASGKSLAYQISVIERLLSDPAAHALLLFPLKALERDQKEAWDALAGRAGLTAEVYDGDTPDAKRRKIRAHPPRVIVTNPDMLHVALLGFHDSWRSFFGNLAYVVLDEVHTYKGVFGSHIAQVLRRVRRVAAEHGGSPKFFASSATVANPGKFVSDLIGEPVSVVEKSGAAVSERHFVFLKPILSPYTVTAKLFVQAVKAGLKTIAFTKSRRMTELISTWVASEEPKLKHRISSYRAGFLPEERREIEAKLFSGKMDGVISTSALEMGIDVGGLDLCLLVGYPGTIINTWQRGGRVGRAGRASAIVLVAGNDALDNYFLTHPDDFFTRQCEEAVVDPGNREILRKHMPCAAAEVPIDPSEDWVNSDDVRNLLDELAGDDLLRHNRTDGLWHSTRRRPQRGVDLRGIGDAFPIFLEDRKTVIGGSSGRRAFTECHKGATYLHRARLYVVTELDLHRKNVIVKPARLNYYTRALSEKDTEITRAPFRHKEMPGFVVREGPLMVTERIIGYEKRLTGSQELIGTVDLDLPPLHFETVGFWIEIPDTIKQLAREADLHFMGGIHALEHAAISLFPLFALCDRDDIGGISTPFHEQVGKAAVFIYDGHPGGVGLARLVFDRIEELLQKTKELIESCPCEQGCPSCIHSPKCGSGNKPLDKVACLFVLELLLNPESAKKQPMTHKKPKETSVKRIANTAQRAAQGSGSKPSQKRIFPDLASPESEIGGADVRSSRPNSRTFRKPARVTQASPPGTETAIVRSSADLDKNSLPRIVFFDLETKYLADEVGGWKNIVKMGMSLAVVYVQGEGFRTFLEDDVGELAQVLRQAELVVGFNHIRFDYEVLRAYSDERFTDLPNLDILVDVHEALGFRLGLNHLAAHTLGESKSGVGTDAVTWFREGRMDLLEQYCRDDVRITRDLFYYGMEHGHLMYKTKRGSLSRVPVSWRERVVLPGS